MSRKIISLDSYLNIVFKNIMFGDMREHFVSLSMVKIWHETQWGPVNPDGGSSTSRSTFYLGGRV